MTEDPTQRIYRRPGDPAGNAAKAPTTAMPGPLDLAGASDDVADSSTTDVLSLDELFDGQPAADVATESAPAAAAAPTWTAMPVIPVRSEPMSAPVAAPSPASAAAHPPMGGRLRSDAADAWDDTVRRTRAWLGRDDNALMLLTALVAVGLILAVAAFAP